LVGALFLTLSVIFKLLLPPEMQAAERPQSLDISNFCNSLTT
jgi:hypothetical protein